LECERS